MRWIHRTRLCSRASAASFVRGAIRRIVIDEDRFPLDALEHYTQLVDQRPYVLTLVERRDDDAEIRPRVHSARGNRAVGSSESVIGE